MHTEPIPIRQCLAELERQLETAKAAHPSSYKRNEWSQPSCAFGECPSHQTG